MTEEELTKELNKEELTELTEEKMDKEDIIDNYIEHIRNISELTDEEIALVIDEAIEDDEELLNVLEKFLTKRENIREKIISVQVEEEKEDKRQEKDDLLDAFEDIDYAYSLEDIIKSLKESGYENPGTIIIDAIGNILYVDSIDEDEVYFALSKKGEALWKLHNLEE